MAIDGVQLHTNTSWVDSLYPSLHLTSDPVAAANLVTALLNAYVPQRQAVGRAFATSAAYYTLVVTQAYSQYLASRRRRRSAFPPGSVGSRPA